MNDDEMTADKVRVFFDNGNETVFHVLDDDDIRTAINRLCEDNGWDPLSVTNYTIEQ